MPEDIEPHASDKGEGVAWPVLKKAADDQFQVGAQCILDARGGIAADEQLFSKEGKSLVGLLCDMIEIGRVPNEPNLEAETPCPNAEFIVNTVDKILHVVPTDLLERREVKQASAADGQTHLLNGMVIGRLAAEDQCGVLLLHVSVQGFWKGLDEFECLCADASVLVQKKEAWVTVCICGGTQCGQRIPDADVFPGGQVADVLVPQDGTAALGAIGGVVEYVNSEAEVDHLLYSFEQAFSWMVENQSYGEAGTSGQN